MNANIEIGRASVGKRLTAGLMMATLGLLLAACILMPGRFTSSLDLRKDGHFSFAYKGEIHFVSPSDLDEGKGDGAKSASKEQEEAQMKAMLGGADLSDPKAAEEFARKLMRQHGWKSVKSMGKGRFDVDYAVSGTLTHDFTFPVIDDFPQANPFVQVILRGDGSARVNAPAFSSGASGSPLRSLARMGAMDEANKDKGPQLPVMEGTFAVSTDGAILANNTEEGPRTDASGSSVLNWKVDDSTASAPSALINLTK
ncbi:MAG: hypothetical protein KDE25_01390 [Novosphingobium sp.]|nr:hypothetical protein [Novosphingobium sp.]